jgi:iron transport multicopper oxidase
MANGFLLESDYSTGEHTYVLNHNDIIELVIHGSANGAVALPLRVHKLLT